MVKIAPDKSLPQTKNRGQWLTLTLVEQMAEHMIARLADMTGPVDFAGLINSWRQSDMRTDGF